MKLISIDIGSDFGFFRKPESNNTINVSYNIIHKPAVLGILGAILGMNGYETKGEFPEYYQKLEHIPIGVEPLNHEQGNYPKTLIKYSNTVGYANKGATFLTSELTLIKPKYRIFLLLDENKPDEAELIQRLRLEESEYIPYFGKNEFTAWWDNFQDYDFERVASTVPITGKIETLFIRNQSIKNNHEKSSSMSIDSLLKDLDEAFFIYFERLPVGFDKTLVQYEIKEMAFTNYPMKNLEKMSDVYYLKEADSYAQLI